MYLRKYTQYTYNVNIFKIEKYSFNFFTFLIIFK